MTEHPLPRRKRLRLAGFDYGSARPYCVTVCTPDRRALFSDYGVSSHVLDCILEGARESGFAVLAVCSMPDHWYALVMPRGNTQDLSGMVRAGKGKATARLRGLGITGRIWQARFYDHIVRDGEDLRQVAEYIVNNPVRKGLVNSAAAYPLAMIFPEAFPA